VGANLFKRDGLIFRRKRRCLSVERGNGILRSRDGQRGRTFQKGKGAWKFGLLCHSRNAARGKGAASSSLCGGQTLKTPPYLMDLLQK